MAYLGDAFTIAITAIVMYSLRRQIAEGIEAFKEELNNWPRGGPPPPMHPSPAGDDSMLRPNSRKSTTHK